MQSTRSPRSPRVVPRHPRVRGAHAIAAVLVLAGILWSCRASSEPVAVRFPEGTLRGLLALRSPNGELLASGDMIQTVREKQVTSRVTYRFRDGSIQDETAVFTQEGQFRLISSHLSQKGPTFPNGVDLTVDTAKGTVATRPSDDKGEGKVETETMDLPPDLANGMLPILLKNHPSKGAAFEVSMIVAAPKPRLVRVAIDRVGTDAISMGGIARDVGHYRGKVNLGGLTGVVAPLVGKQPEDIQMWLLEGEVPVLLRSDAQMFAEGPVWRIELLGPDASPRKDNAPAAARP